jgi:hypothetical protein
MRYVKVRWIHASPDYPETLYSELDQDMWEIRKVEVYADGRMDFADNDRRSGNTKLGIVPHPSLEEIATDPQFKPMLISAEEFESIWNHAREQLKSKFKI